MNQRKLMQLLKEAAHPACTKERRITIRLRIQKSQATRGTELYETKREGIEDLLDKLFVEVTEFRPELLPNFYPVFALAYGNRKPKTLFAQIDWWPIING